ncbi:MAG TPA: glycosyl transferase family 28 [Nocardioides bacterium]|uniref:glycosyltransferase n=1 Tax=uncultured Nocardioides sp. TaxID=198441 RepID=UPI000ECA2AE5|nr:glycosyltransferase [uncultured Nocardioides sp.]HCB03045.1 glycosyl transferase family 28 [Nocardioides sp.]
MTADPVKALVVALAGTDHHPFERLVDWMDAAAQRRPDVRFLVQHGSTTRAPRTAEGVDFLTHDRLVALLTEASVVVCHGGPGTIMDAREAGHVPLCVPRDPALGEHVDGHQQRFAAHVGEAGVVRHVTSQASFDTELDSALEAAASPGELSPATVARDDARARLAAQLDELMTVRPQRLNLRFRSRV